MEPVETMVDAYLVIDLEGTCSQDESIPTKEGETIEVGAVIASPSDWIRGTFSHFVQPSLHPVLTEFCKELTTITQADVDSAEKFPIVISQLMAFAEFYGLDSFYSWGTYDRDQFIRDCRFHKIRYPFKAHTDLAKLFRKKTGRKRGKRGAMRYFGILPTGSHHRGLDCVLNIAKMLPFLI